MKIFLILVILFITLDILIVAYVIWKRTRKKVSEKERREVQKAWKGIIKQKDRRHAIMDADKLLDHALSLLGYKGSLGNKLKQSASLFSNINKVWAAHKIRNNIAHQMNYEVDEKTYRRTMLYFKQAFKDLKMF